MIHEKRQYSVLIVSSSKKFNTSMAKLLAPGDYKPVHTVNNIASAQRRIMEMSYDLVMINTPLPDEFGRRFAIEACRSKSTVVVLFVKNQLYEDIYPKVFRHGVLTLRKPTSVSVINQSLDWMRAIHERLRGLENKAISMEEKMAEIRTVNRAKWLLIESQNLSEADAHRYIEKQAMDRCITKGEVAAEIISHNNE